GVDELVLPDDLVGVRRFEPDEDSQQRRLAAAVGLEHAEPRSVGHVEVQAGEDEPAAEGLREVAGRDHAMTFSRPTILLREFSTGGASSVARAGVLAPRPRTVRVSQTVVGGTGRCAPSSAFSATLRPFGRPIPSSSFAPTFAMIPSSP